MKEPSSVHPSPIVKQLKAAVRVVSAELTRHENELNLLREIDEYILSSGFENLHKIFDTALESSPRFVGRNVEAALYIRNHQLFVRSIGTIGKISACIDADVTTLDQMLGSKGCIINCVQCGIKTGVEGDNIKAFGFPLRYPKDFLLGVFVFVERVNSSGSDAISKPEIREAIRRVCSQLQLAFQTLHQKYLEAVERDIWTYILDGKVAPESAFQYFVNQAHRFLPSFEGLTLSEKPYVNTLAYDSEAKELHLRAATEEFGRSAFVPVPIHESITGMLAEDSSIEVLNIDPRNPNFAGKFLKYSNRTSLPTREIALSLSDRHGMVGVLNFEFFELEVVCPAVEEFLVLAKPRLSQIFTAIQSRYDSSLINAQGEAATIGEFLRTIGQQFRHDVMTQLTGSVSYLDARISKPAASTKLNRKLTENSTT